MFYTSVHEVLLLLFCLYSFTIVEAAEALSTTSSSSVFAKPPAFLLGGDSTTQPKTGWGDAFLSLVQRPAIGKNFGRGGRTTISFKTDGTMAKLVAEVAKDSAQHSVIATLQVSRLETYSFGGRC